MQQSIDRGNPPYLGVGLGLRPIHYPDIFLKNPSVDWFEIISENFLTAQGFVQENLEWVLSRYKVVQHGVSLSIGSADPLDFDYLKKLKDLARKTKTPWLSDHLCWGQVEGSHYHDLLPLPFTKEVVAYVAERARIVQDYLEIPFALENVSSYAGYTCDEMSEWEFYGSVIDKAGIFMMLDVNNIYVSSRNHSFDPEDYYTNLPLEKVVQIHLAGHKDYGTYCLDTHDNYVRDEVWQLYAKVIERIGRPISTLLEWDEEFISFDETWQEALKAKQFLYCVACSSLEASTMGSSSGRTA